MSLFFLTKIQEKVFWSLGEGPISVTDLAKQIKVPRTTVAKALVMLKDIGLATSRKVREKNRHLYERAKQEDINNQIESLRSELFNSDTTESKKTFSLDSEESLGVYTGKKGVYSAMQAFLTLRKGERVYVAQGKDAVESWTSFLGEEKILQIHENVRENKTIVVGIRSEGIKNEVFLRKNLQKSFEGRIASSHAIPDEFFEEKTSLYVSRGLLLFVNLKKGHAIRIDDKLFSQVLIKLFQFIIKRANRD